MAEQASRRKRKVRIVSCSERTRSKPGAEKEWVLYNVVAADENGIPIDEKLTAWSKFEASDKLVDVEVEAGEYKGEKQYTLYPVREKKLPERIEAAETELINMRERMSRLEARLEAVEGEASSSAGGGPATSTPAADW